MVSISKLTPADVGAVDALMKRYSGTLGFLPRVVLEKHLEDQCVLGAKTQEGQLAGYLLYAAYPDRFRIVQLCVSGDFKSQGLARRLLEALKATATTQKVMKLRCRSDFPAHRMWPKLGFVPVSEKAGRSKEGHPLTLWRLTLTTGDQLALFRANVSEEILDVIIDAQIFFDFDEPDSDTTQPSKALLSDFFIDSLNLWFADELLTEISRNLDADQRRDARARTGQFFEVSHDPLLLGDFTESLKRILPSGTESQLSDINHLGKAASSDINIFVTRDQALLKKATEIADSVNLRVLSPTELIIQLRELSEGQTDTPDRVSGLGLEWQRLASNQFAAFPFTRFLDQGEKLGQLREKIDSLLVDPAHELEVLRSENDPVALRVLTYRSPKAVIVSLGRVAVSQDRSLFGRFLIADVVYKAIRKNLDIVKFEASALPLSLVQGLSEMGFTRCNDDFVRFCFARYLDREGALSEIAELSPEAVGTYRDMSHLDLERSCSPLTSAADQSHFLIPIRPGYALNLFDRQQSAQDLFGGTPGVLLRWSNVYYRAANFHKMLKGPGRILWYVSGGSKEIVAVAHLDEVVIDTPKELFRRFMKYGTLEWSDLYKMCKGDTSTKLMALRFSNTFPLQRRVPLGEIWTIFDEDGIGRSLQAPRKISPTTFRKLFQRGYPERP